MCVMADYMQVSMCFMAYLIACGGSYIDSMNNEVKCLQKLSVCRDQTRDEAT